MTIKKIEITPSILSADFRKLEREVKDVEAAGADRIHCDVMDGHFVPNLTFGPMVVEAVKRCVSIPLDVHLMISEPVRYVDSFCSAGADILTVHAEACADFGATISAIKNNDVRVGVTVNPDLSIDLFLPELSRIDQVLIMTVYAGFGGQKFIDGMLDKIKAVSDAEKSRGLTIDIQVDGGINKETAGLCAAAGANVFVAGNYIFSSGNYGDMIDNIRRNAQDNFPID